MKFSVVIPLYNKGRHISRAINSVLKQTYGDFELIVVDDGSTDFGANEVKKFKDSRIKLVHQANSGVSAARNKGISLAKNDYIGFLDADDAWKPTFLQTIYALIKKYPKAGAYATAYEIVNNQLKTLLPESILSIQRNWEGIIDDYFKFALKSPLISASSVVIPKSTFMNIGQFSVGVKRGEDLEMWCRIALNYNIAFSNKVCATYFQNTDNRACNKKAILSDSFCSYAEDLLLEGKKEHSIYFEEYIIKMLIAKSRYYIIENKNREARKILYKYRYTKYNKKDLIKTYILSLLPKSVYRMLIAAK